MEYNEMKHNTFPRALADMEFGGLTHRLSENLETLVQEVRDTNRVGSLTLKLKVKPAGAEGQLEVESEVDLKRPKPDAGKSLFFSTAQGQLLRKNPRQSEMPFGEDDSEDEDAPRKYVVGE